MLRIIFPSILSALLINSIAFAEEPVYFADSNLKTQVELSLGISDPTPTDMLNLTYLNASKENISNLTGLEYAHNLDALYLNDNKISDINQLSTLVNIKYLLLGNNQISDIRHLSELKNLLYLGLDTNLISDIEPLSGLINIRVLFLHNNQISNISPLSGLVNLKNLWLPWNQISDISPLLNLPNLEEVNLCLNPLSDESYVIVDELRLRGVDVDTCGNSSSTPNDPNTPYTVKCIDVTTLEPTNVTETSVTLRGRIDDDKGRGSCEYWFVLYDYDSYQMNPDPNDYNEWLISTLKPRCCASEGQIFSEDVTGLKPGTNYMYISLVFDFDSDEEILYYGYGSYVLFWTGGDSSKPPKCYLTVEPASGAAPLEVSFTMIASDPDGDISSWSLDIDNDGSAEYSGSGSPPSNQQHTYTSQGNYTAILSVTDNEGAIDTDTETINVFSSGTGTLKVETNPGIANVYIDNQNKGQTPSTGYLTISNLTVGNHNLRVTKTGYQDWTGDITINPNDITYQTVTLIPVNPSDITLTLYVHEDRVDGDIISGARVTGKDGNRVNFDKTTNSSGYVTITGKPGSWQFNVSKIGYQTNSWLQDTTSSVIRDAFIYKIQEPSGDPPSEDYFLGNQDNTSGSTADPINTATGNYIHQETDLQIRSCGKALSFTRYYNSKSQSNSLGDPLGIGWSHSYNIVLNEYTLGLYEGLVSIKWADGRTDYWHSRSDEGICEPHTPGLYDTLYYDPSGNWTLTTTEYDIYSFSRKVSYGRLESIADKNGNIITLEYEHPDSQWLVTSINDPLDRSIDFSYENQRISSIQDFASTPRVVQYSYTEGQLTQVTDVLGGTTQYTYDPNGYLQTVTNQSGITTVVNTYDSQGRVAEQLDGKGRLTTLDYDSPEPNQTTITDPMGYITIHTHYTGYKLLRSIENPLGEVISYLYDPNLNRIAITDRNNHTTSFEYDTFGNVIRKIDPDDPNDSNDGGVTTVEYNNLDFPHLPTKKINALGYEIAYEYDDKGNVIRQINPDSTERLWTYNSFGQKLTETDENDNTTTLVYDEDGLLIQTVNPEGDNIWYGYDELWRRTSITDGRGSFSGNPKHTTVIVFDNAGRIISAVGPIISRSYQYDEIGNLTHSTNGRGYTTVYYYDNTDNLIKVEKPAPDSQTQSIECTYDGLNNRISMIDPNGNITTYEYDAAGRLTAITNPEGNQTTSTYDAQGNVLSQTDGSGVTTYYEYDSLNRKIHTYNDLGNHWYRYYDRLGNLTGEIDANGNITTYQYDSLNRLIAVVDDMNNTTEYQYDAIGNLTSIIDGCGKVISRRFYDKANRLIKKEDGLGNAYEYGYDEFGNLIWRKDANGNITTYVYDNENRLIETQYPNLTNVTYIYDDNGNLILIFDSTGVTSYTYDELDRLISSTDGFGKTVSYNYDIVGNRIALTYPSDSNNPQRMVLYSYDKANRLDKIADWDGRIWDYDTDGAGRITSLTYPNGTKKEQSYDTVGRLLSMSYQKSDYTEFMSFGYTRDGQGNPINITEFGTLLSGDLSPTNIEYTYDELNRLTYSEEPAEIYSYDHCSNLVSRTENSSTIDFTYDNDNRLTSSSQPGTYTYDKNGNMTSRIFDGEYTFFNYDYENRLVSQISDDSSVKHYYNGLGNRIARNDNSIITRYVLDYGRNMSQILCETDSSGKIIAYYIHGPQIVGRFAIDGSQRYYHTNHIGSVVALTDETETVTDRYAYTPFGTLTDREGDTQNPFTFVGGLGVMEEGNGLYFMRARFYDPGIGRFLSTDPVDGQLRLPTSYNKYLYSDNNPLVYTDPSGEAILESITTAVALKIADLVTFVYSMADIVYKGATGELTTKDVLVWSGGFVLVWYPVPGIGTIYSGYFALEDLEDDRGLTGAISDLLSDSDFDTESEVQYIEPSEDLLFQIDPYLLNQIIKGY